MSIIQRLDVAVQRARFDGHDIVEVDVSQEDYADLMTFAAGLDDHGLEQVGLNMLDQTYLGHRLIIEQGLRESQIILEDGAEPLPKDEVAIVESRIHKGELSESEARQ